ncbi:MAG: DUF2147 domain-containing protein [Tunicatimonas sp.]
MTTHNIPTTVLLKAVAGIILFFTAPSLWAQEANDIVGKWYTEEKKATVEIYTCGDKYCGKIVSLQEPKNPDGTTKRDVKNPSEDLRSRTIVGSDILTSLQYDGGNDWEDGEIYDPESGKTYSCRLELEDANTLEVRGFIGVSLLGRSQTWTRAK